jgi:hypothetical protein
MEKLSRLTANYEKYKEADKTFEEAFYRFDKIEDLYNGSVNYTEKEVEKANSRDQICTIFKPKISKTLHL